MARDTINGQESQESEEKSMKKLWAIDLFDAVPLSGITPIEVRLASEVDAALAELQQRLDNVSAWKAEESLAAVKSLNAALAQKDSEIAFLKGELSTVETEAGIENIMEQARAQERAEWEPKLAKFSIALSAAREQLAAAQAEVERLRREFHEWGVSKP